MCRSQTARLTVLVFSAVFALAVTVPASAQGPKGKKYALLIGVTAYDNDKFSTLKYTENDVEELAAVLKSKAAGFNEVVVLTNTRAKKDKAAAPTAANMRKQLARLTEKRDKGDLILFAFAGLGSQIAVKDPDGRHKPKVRSYLFPRDADPLGISYRTGLSKTLFHVGQLCKTLGESKAGTKLVLLDAGREEIKNADGEIEQVIPPAGTAVLFSCREGQRSWESPKLAKGHGVFFYHVIQALKGEAANKKGEVTWGGLMEHVTESVSEDVPRIIGDGAKQTPVELKQLVGPSPVLIPKR